MKLVKGEFKIIIVNIAAIKVTLSQQAHTKIPLEIRGF